MAQSNNTQPQIQKEIEARDQIMKADIKLMNDLNDFNKKYAKYINCNNSSISSSCNPSDLTCCTASDKNISNILTAQNTVNTDLDSINKLITGYKGTIINPSVYENKHQQIIRNSKESHMLRRELDEKLKEVYKLNTTNTADSVIQHDSAMYKGIFFTILVTSVIYLTFTKL